MQISGKIKKLIRYSIPFQSITTTILQIFIKKIKSHKLYYSPNEIYHLNYWIRGFYRQRYLVNCFGTSRIVLNVVKISDSSHETVVA